MNDGFAVICSCNYLIYFKRDYTLGEFVREIFKTKPNDCGHIKIYKRSAANALDYGYSCMYDRGKFVLDMPIVGDVDVKIVAAGIDTSISDSIRDYILVLDR